MYTKFNYRIIHCFIFSIFLIVCLTQGTLSQPTQTTTDEHLMKIYQELGALKESLAQQKSWRNPTVLSPLLIAIGGWLFAYFTLVRSQERQERAKTVEHLFDALHWFEGDTQKRSVGIAVVEAHWKDYKKELESVWVSVLVNQSIHLLARSTSRDSPTERNNLDRIIELLKVASLSENQRKNLCDEIANANWMDCHGNIILESIVHRDRGIYVEVCKIKKWQDHFKCQNVPRRGLTNASSGGREANLL